jgi:hypothetical protein
MRTRDSSSSPRRRCSGFGAVGLAEPPFRRRTPAYRASPPARGTVGGTNHRPLTADLAHDTRLICPGFLGSAKLRDSEKRVVVEAVSPNWSPHADFPANREKNRETRGFWPREASFELKNTRTIRCLCESSLLKLTGKQIRRCREIKQDNRLEVRLFRETRLKD